MLSTMHFLGSHYESLMKRRLTFELKEWSKVRVEM